MKKFIGLMSILLALMLVVSCKQNSDESGSGSSEPSIESGNIGGNNSDSELNNDELENQNDDKQNNSDSEVEIDETGTWKNSSMNSELKINNNGTWEYKVANVNMFKGTYEKGSFSRDSSFDLKVTHTWVATYWMSMTLAPYSCTLVGNELRVSGLGVFTK